jgi:hypothetical protein
LAPLNKEAYLNRAAAFNILGDVPASRSDYDYAIALDKEYSLAIFGKGMLELSCWNYSPDIWRMYKEGQKVHVGSGRPWYPQPEWSGNESLVGKTILIYPEQGYGDFIQFIRFVPMLLDRGAKVIIEIHSPLVRLIDNIGWDVTVVKLGSELPHFDYHICVVGLLWALEVNSYTAKKYSTYLSANSDVKLAPNKVRIGLVWNGGAKKANFPGPDINPRRNIPLELFDEFSHLKIDWYSLQKDVESFESKLTIINLMGGVCDFLDTGRIIDTLDLVISVDTSTAHLAAAMGKEVWLLNRFDSCWRWGRVGEATPWYPCMKIFRQTSLGDWSNVITDVHQALLAKFGDRI